MSMYFEEYAERQQEQNERWTKTAELARKNELVLVQVSARRYTVVQLTSSCGQFSVLNKPGRYTYMSGSVIYGPSTYSACRDYIADKTGPIPDDIHTS